MLAPMLEAARRRAEDIDVAEARRLARGAPPSRSLSSALTRPGLAVIAEIKRRSPSRGDLAPGLDPVRRAGLYARAGAAAISVLTDSDFFGGSLEDLAAVRASVSLPVLRKDFIVHPAQVWESRAIGADALLLILAALDDRALRTLYAETIDAGMEALVEVHDADEARRAVELGARIVGVNNRDLATFDVDLATSEELAPLLGGVDVTVAESGIHRVEDAQRMAEAGYDGVLVGESLVTAPDPAALLTELAAVSP